MRNEIKKLILTLTLLVLAACSGGGIEVPDGNDGNRSFLENMALVCQVSAPTTVKVSGNTGRTIPARVQAFQGPFPVASVVTRAHSPTLGLVIQRGPTGPAIAHDFTLLITSGGTKRIKVEVTGEDGKTALCELDISVQALPPGADPEAMLFADRAEVPMNTSATLSWLTAGAPEGTECVLSYNGTPFATTTADSGITNSPPIQSVSIFSLECAGMPAASVTVGVLPSPTGGTPPAVQFGASTPTSGGVRERQIIISAGSQLTLIWSSPEADRCDIVKNDFEQLVDLNSGLPIRTPSGQFTFPQFSETAIFRLICAKEKDGEIYFVTSSLLVLLDEMAIQVTANPTTVNSGQSSQVSYRVSGASPQTICQLNKIPVRTQDDPSTGTTVGTPTPAPGQTVSFSTGVIAESTKFSIACVEGTRNALASVVVDVSAQWYQVNNEDDGEDCGNFCPAIGLTNIADPDGHKCTSGEMIPALAFLVISYAENGCWKSCTPHGRPNATNSGRKCYGDGQKKDNDKTDRSVGCYCG